MCRSSNHLFKRFSSGSQLALTDRVLAGSLAPHTATGCKNEISQVINCLFCHSFTLRHLG